MKNWLDLKVQGKNTTNIASYYWKTFECELCKNAYPYIFKVGQQTYKLVNIKRPETNRYVVMESLPLEKNSSRTIHVLTFTDEVLKMKMGRGHDSEIRVNDISVSRIHAFLNYKPDGIYI